MVVILKKLTYAAMLSPSEASKEFREGVLRCFRAILLCLHLCPNKSCSCKQVNDMPTLLDGRDMHSILPKDASETEECLLAFLHSQTASAAVGHWLSLLLKAADIEAGRGHRGSAKVRVEAFFTLRMLVAKVISGVVSQFAKVLHVSKTMISGAAGSVEAIDQAIRGLAQFLMLVLEDDANISGLGMPVNASTGFHSNTDDSAISFLEQLRHLPVKSQDQSVMVVENPSEAVHIDTPKFGLKEKGSVNSGNVIGSFHKRVAGEPTALESSSVLLKNTKPVWVTSIVLPGWRTDLDGPKHSTTKRCQLHNLKLYSSGHGHRKEHSKDVDLEQFAISKDNFAG
ncbi:hypothetical protein RHMOL_Rhmol02G0176700 [Rhododendron molle]|uniref:Uncharacterized protein n=1 Tax=Rhododendron molle TaxID=49168 RepID=A0ACC0PSP6_RHOML|nr:hypothetical protein RHMOL_Rhmol02G0176700 [Rhododendron molle]